jgi:hypothetical protein
MELEPTLLKIQGPAPVAESYFLLLYLYHIFHGRQNAHVR